MKHALALKVPRVNPVGLVELPGDYPGRGRAPRWPLRLAAACVLLAFTAVVIASSAISLGRYCLTSDGANTAALPIHQSDHGP